MRNDTKQNKSTMQNGVTHPFLLIITTMTAQIIKSIRTPPPPKTSSMLCTGSDLWAKVRLQSARVKLTEAMPHAIKVGSITMASNRYAVNPEMRNSKETGQTYTKRMILLIG